jgi:hypothetical protein
MGTAPKTPFSRPSVLTHINITESVEWGTHEPILVTIVTLYIPMKRCIAKPTVLGFSKQVPRESNSNRPGAELSSGTTIHLASVPLS